MSVAPRINNCQVLNIKILWSGIGLFNFLTWLHLGKIAAAVVLTQPQSGAFQKVVCTNYLLLTNYHYLALTTKILEKYAAVQFAEIEVIWEIMIEWHNEIYCEIYSYILRFLWLYMPPGSSGSLRGKPPGADGEGVWEDGGLRRAHRFFHKQEVLH